MYKIFVRFNYEDIIKGYYNTLAEAEAGLAHFKQAYIDQGYDGVCRWYKTVWDEETQTWIRVIEHEETIEVPIYTETSEECVWTLTRIPFGGSTGDPGTGEKSYTPTGMTDTIEIHLELGNKSYAINDWKISCPENRAKMWAMGKIVPVTPGPTPPTPGTATITVSVEYGSITIDGEGTLSKVVTKGTSHTIQCTPLSGFKFDHWSDGSVSNPRTEIINSDLNISTTCVPVYQRLLTVACENGNVSVQRAGHVIQPPYLFDDGETALLTVTADTGYKFREWSDFNFDNPRSLVMNSDKDLTASCTAKQAYVISVTTPVHCTVTGTGTYYEDDTCTLTCTPDTGYKFKSWTASGMLPITSNPYSFPVTGAKEFTCNVEMAYCNLTYTPNDHLSFGSCPDRGQWGSTITLTADPNAHHEFVQWWDGDTTNPRQWVVPAQDEFTVSAVGRWVQVRLDLSISHTGDPSLDYGSVVKIPSQETYDYSSTPTVEYTALPGKTQFTSWSDGGAQRHTVSLLEDKELTATVQSIPQELALNATNGVINTHEGSSWLYGGTLTISFSPAEHYHFDHWSDGVTQNERGILMDGTMTSLGCVGVIDQHSVSTITPHFTIKATVDGVTYDLPHSFDYGTEVTFSYIADAHYHFSAWDGGETTETVTRTITQDTIINLFYTSDPQYTVTLHSDHGTVVGAGTYWEHEDVTVNVLTVDDEYQFKKWTNHSSPNWSITDIRANVEDTVEYEDWHGLAITNFTTSTQVLTMKHTYGSSYPDKKVSWSKDRIHWSSWYTTSSSTTQDIQFQGLETYYIKGDVHGFNSSKYFRIYCYGADAKFDISGRVTSLADGVGNETPAVPGNNYYWGSLFQGFNGLRSVTDDLLPYTSGYAQCYFQMFYGCFNLTKAPRIKIQQATGTMSDMFQRMFQGCTLLDSVTFDLASKTSSTSISHDMMSGVAASGTFKGTAAMHPETGTSPYKWLKDSADGVPVGWTYETLPEPSEE